MTPADQVRDEVPLRIEVGQVSILRLFDVANAIASRGAEREAAGGAPVRIHLTHAKPKAIAYGFSPLAISLGRIDVQATPLPFAAEVTARIFDFGVVSLTFRLHANGLDWSDFADLVDRNITLASRIHTFGCDPSEPEPVPEFDFDQSHGA